MRDTLQGVTASLAIVIASSMWAAPLQAHHSYALFNMQQRQAVAGTVRALEWTNPHVWLWLDSVTATGEMISSGFEAEDPAELIRWSGWSKQALKAGDQITVEYCPFKSGVRGGSLLKVTSSDGRVLTTAGNKSVAAKVSPDAPDSEAK